MYRMCPETAVSGSRSNARTARSSWWWAGLIPRARIRGSGLCCWHITIPTGVLFMPVAPELESVTQRLERLWRRLQLLATSEMPLDKAPPRANRFGSPLVLSRVHWVRPELVVEVKYLTWTEENLLRQVVYKGLRENKIPTDVQRPVPN